MFLYKKKEKKAELIVFPEAALFGYHPFDLLERESLVVQQNKALQKILKACSISWVNIYSPVRCSRRETSSIFF